MNNTTVQLRVDPKTKHAVSRIFKALGLDISTGIKIYFQQVIRCKGLPFLIADGIVTPARARAWLRYVRNQRQKSWRQHQP